MKKSKSIRRTLSPLAFALSAAASLVATSHAQEAPKRSLCQVAGKNCISTGDVFYGNLGVATRGTVATGVQSETQIAPLRFDGAIQSADFGIAGRAGTYLGTRGSYDVSGDFRVINREGNRIPTQGLGLTYGVGGRIAKATATSGDRIHENHGAGHVGLSYLKSSGTELALLAGVRTGQRITRASTTSETNVSEFGPSLSAALLSFNGTLQLDCNYAPSVTGKIKGVEGSVESKGAVGGCELSGQTARRKVGPISAALFGSYGLMRRSIATEVSPGSLEVGRERAQGATIGVSLGR